VSYRMSRFESNGDEGVLARAKLSHVYLAKSFASGLNFAMSLPTTISLTARDPTRPTAASTTASGPAPPPLSGVIPMSLPALLQNPRVKQLQQKPRKERPPVVDPVLGQGGKRKQRRVQNGALARNPSRSESYRSLTLYTSCIRCASLSWILQPN
jgi:hypothetical protein